MSDSAAPVIVGEIVTCTFCDGRIDADIKFCIKCSRPFCPLHSSKISPNCCQECFATFAFVVDKYTREDVEYNEKTDSITTHKSSSRRIKLDGPDYVWYSLAIQRLTDPELESMFQFHRFMVSLLEHTTTVRLVKRTQEHTGPSTKGILTSTTTEVKKTRKVKTQKSLRDVLIASGITDKATLAAMLAAAGVV